jgi:hypothetical protein
VFTSLDLTGNPLADLLYCNGKKQCYGLIIVSVQNLGSRIEYKCSGISKSELESSISVLLLLDGVLPSFPRSGSLSGLYSLLLCLLGSSCSAEVPADVPGCIVCLVLLPLLPGGPRFAW